MNRTTLFAMALSTMVAGGATLFYGQGTPVDLQATTPGTQQIGHANVSGTILAGSIQASSAGPTAQVIVGNATSATGANFGGFFRSDSVLGRALYGRASATSGTTHGVWGQSDSPAGRGVTGVAPATTGNATGVWGQTASTTGRGVYGYTTSATGVNYGVYGQSSSPAGFGVYAQGNMHASGMITATKMQATNGSTSGSEFGVHGIMSSTAPGGFSAAVRGQNNGTGASGIGVWGSQAGTGWGVLGQSATGFGVYGSASSAAGSGVGGSFESFGATGRGVTGVAQATSGTNFGGHFTSLGMSGRGVYAAVPSSSGLTIGVQAVSASSQGRGLFAEATAATGNTYGGYFLTRSTTGIGVFAWADAATGATSGVLARNDSASTGAAAVKGVATADSGNVTYGGRFENASKNGRAVSGIVTSTGGAGVSYGGHFENAHTNGRGVFGWTTASSGSIYGVLGQSLFAGFGVYAFGSSGASGTKSFRIDHPGDPENKYLLHYSSESPMPQNFYVGNVTTDAQGYAWVDLPDYFSDINTNFKYQLTVVDDEASADFVQVKIGKKIKGNRFLIMSSKPRIEVSWRVDADRNDLFVRKHQPKDVMDKEGSEKGTYQHPELYGHGQERQTNYDPADAKMTAPPAAKSKR